MKKKNLQKFIVYVFLASSLIIPSLIAGSQIVNASSSNEKYVPLAPLPCVAGGDVTCPEGEGALQKEVDFQGYIQYAFNILIALSAVAAVFMIVWGGITYMTTDAYFTKKEGLEKVKNAVTGLLLVLCSYIILKTIDPRLVEIPSTLVPQITTYNEALTEDVTKMLLGQIESEINEYEEKRNEIGDSLKEINKEKVAIKTELDDIEKEMAGLNLGLKEDQDKYQSLSVEKKKIQDKQNAIEVNYQKEQLKSDLNGILSDATNAVKLGNTSDGFFDDVSKRADAAIAQLKLYEETADAYTEARTKRIKELGQNDLSEEKEQLTYTKSLIELKKIDVLLTTSLKNDIISESKLFEDKFKNLEQTISGITDSQLKSDFKEKEMLTKALFESKIKE